MLRCLGVESGDHGVRHHVWLSASARLDAVFRVRLPRLCAAAGLVAAAATSGLAQGASPVPSEPTPSNGSVRDSATVGTFRRLPPRNGYNLWVGSSVSGTYTASDNESLGGHMRIVGVQWTRDLFAWKGARFSWVTEVLPLMLVNSSAPVKRIPPVLRDPARPADPALLRPYLAHNSYGFGISPLSAQAEFTHSPRVSTVLQVTSGAAWFSDVVPYGQATQYNFTVNPSVAVHWQASRSARMAFGYTFHHLSNASFGPTNPGMHSHLFFTRITNERAR